MSNRRKPRSSRPKNGDDTITCPCCGPQTEVTVEFPDGRTFDHVPVDLVRAFTDAFNQRIIETGSFTTTPQPPV